jgi:hypothetical protein
MVGEDIVVGDIGEIARIEEKLVRDDVFRLLFSTRNVGVEFDLASLVVEARFDPPRTRFAVIEG